MGLAMASAITGLSAQEKDDPKQMYLSAIKQELARLNLDMRCDNVAKTCFITQPSAVAEGTVFNIIIKYSDHTDTIYMYIDRYLTLGDSGEPDEEMAKQLLALNSELVTAKFEWDRAGNAIRLSTVLNTDSNFDRRAFRSQVKGLIEVAEKLWTEFHPKTPKTVETE